MSYRHTQRAPLSTILLILALGLACWGAFASPRATDRFVLYIACLLLALFAYCFQSLTVEDRGDHLFVHYGPIPLFRKRIAYGQMVAVRQARSKLIDGWGVHYVPGRGWTYNLWGFDCVEIDLDRGSIRIGSDQAVELAHFLESKIRPAEPRR